MQVNSGTKADLVAGLVQVTLLVKDLSVETDFYEQLGLKVVKKGRFENLDMVDLGTGHTPFLRLLQNENAVQPPRNMAGLYHFAILLPDRASLGEAYLRIGNKGIIFEGFADHGVSEAIYLSDPEGNGIEIYADRPRNDWIKDADGGIRMFTKQLDIDSLIKEAKEKRLYNDSFPENTRIGHIHLKVTNLERSVKFYKKVLGLEVMQEIYSAAFLSYSGYHHHVGMNTWESLGGPAREENYAGLYEFTIRCDYKAKERLQSEAKDKDMPISFYDPDNIRVNLIVPK